MAIDIIYEIFKKVLDLIPLGYIIPILILLFIYIKRQWFKKYLSALLNIKFLADLRKENIENLVGNLSIYLSSVSATSDKLRISYIITNFSIFDVTLYKLLEDRVELSGGINRIVELPKSDFQQEKTIKRQKNEVFELERKLDRDDISKIIKKVNKCKESGAPLILTVPITGYFRCEYVKEPLKVCNTCVFRVPHYDLNFREINEGNNEL
jgi:hypothetical protein